jgi:hypothetical protein
LIDNKEQFGSYAKPLANIQSVRNFEIHQEDEDEEIEINIQERL